MPNARLKALREPFRRLEALAVLYRKARRTLAFTHSPHPKGFEVQLSTSMATVKRLSCDEVEATSTS